MTRRSALELAALGAAAAAVQGAPADPPFTLPKLPYAYDALEPHIDAQTMQIHHDKHHQAYVDNLNKAVATDPALGKLSVEELLQRLDTRCAPRFAIREEATPITPCSGRLSRRRRKAASRRASWRQP